MKITAQTPLGMVLLALRAGQMEAGQIAERFQNIHNATRELTRLGYIEPVLGNTGYFRLTAAGRRACPSRRAEKDKKCA